MDAPTGTSTSPELTPEELQLATRNHGMPLEALAYDVTPVGLHYLLVHYDIPVVDPATWRLRVHGNVERPLELTLSDLVRRPAVEHTVTLECAGNGRARLQPRPLSQPWLHEAVGTATWLGTPLAPILEEAGPRDGTVEVVFTGLDRGVEGGITQQYQRSLTLDEAGRDGVILAYSMNGQPLPPQHGFPARLVVPGWYGMASVKWLVDIEAVTAPFAGYQQARSYRYRQHPDEDGTPVDRIAVRSLMIPPGIPDFLTRRRVVALGPTVLTGRAWSGQGPIVEVAVSVDGGGRWMPAELGPPSGQHAWRHWRAVWDPPGPGEYELGSRATDASGATQPMSPSWNLGGYAVNAVQRVAVTVTG